MPKNLTQQEIFETKHYMTCEFPYHCRIILPYAAGAAILALLEEVEIVDTDMYSAVENELQINITKKFKVETLRVSRAEYQTSKIKALLGVTTDSEPTA
jgi:hypothetical protein